MPKVVSNTTPIISLLKLSRLSILKDLYSEISIPHAVYQEIEAGNSKKYYQDLSKLDWVSIVKVKDKEAIKYFLDLDAGEAEAIVLANELQADLIIVDESLGRFYAKHAGLNVTGTIGVLIKAKKKGIIKELKPLLFELIKKDVWISKKLVSDVLKEAGE
ncbi:MAG: DUF3368 domain-containing protein [Bacteroidales bacterium]|nr:DUF3368 domain-containing protein [Bacteroidales bacterium]